MLIKAAHSFDDTGNAMYRLAASSRCRLAVTLAVIFPPSRPSGA